jgi:HEAT repeat protein
MTIRRALWLVFALAVLAALAVLVPGSPAYLPDMFAPDGYFGHSHDGHTAGYWKGSLRSDDARVRNDAIFALGAIGADASEAVPELAVILRDDPDEHLRSQAALALSKMVPASRVAVPELGQALGDEFGFVRMNAALALSRLRTDARPAVPALMVAIKDERNQTNLGVFHFTIQQAVTLALGRASAGTPEAVPALTEALAAARTGPMRHAVVQALGDVGADARPAAGQLRTLLDEKDIMLQKAVREALEKIEQPAPAGG